jgi:hypothetical protein
MLAKKGQDARRGLVIQSTLHDIRENADVCLTCGPCLPTARAIPLWAGDSYQLLPEPEFMGEFEV